MLKPPLMIMSFLRSISVRKPSSSKRPMSPVRMKRCPAASCLLARMRGSFASEGFENIINKASVVIRIEEIERGDQREPYKVTECVGADIVVELP